MFVWAQSIEMCKSSKHLALIVVSDNLCSIGLTKAIARIGIQQHLAQSSSYRDVIACDQIRVIFRCHHMADIADIGCSIGRAAAIASRTAGASVRYPGQRKMSNPP
jgi:hypothetical protein